MVSVSDRVIHQAAMEEAARRERMRAAWAAYHGDTPGPLRIRPGAPDDNVRVNYARYIVDSGVSFLVGGGVSIRPDEALPAAASRWLQSAWTANRKATLLHRLVTNGAVCGQAFLKMARPAIHGGMPRLIILDPMTVQVRWEPDDWERIVRYEILWDGIDPVSGRAAAFRQLIDRRRDAQGWTILDQRSDGDDVRWHTTAAEIWPFPWSPVLGCQNLPAANEYWGRSDLEPDVLALCRSIDFVLSNAARILRFHAHPKMWGHGFSAEGLSLGPDEVTILPQRDAALHLLEMQGDLGSSMDLYARLLEALHETARVPAHAASSLQGLGRLSGVALRLLYQPLMEKTMTKRMLYGELLVEASRRLLEMGGYEPAGIEIEWPSVAPTDPLEEARTALLYRDLGMSSEAALRRLGLAERSEGGCPDDST
ncbi:MAG: phage portal protein [Chthonomonadales bacterium]|nr:phage portal protein [Chthonomonadales bacterium]